MRCETVRRRLSAMVWRWVGDDSATGAPPAVRQPLLAPRSFCWFCGPTVHREGRELTAIGCWGICTDCTTAAVTTLFADGRITVMQVIVACQVALRERQGAIGERTAAEIRTLDQIGEQLEQDLARARPPTEHDAR